MGGEVEAGDKDHFRRRRRQRDGWLGWLGVVGLPLFKNVFLGEELECRWNRGGKFAFKIRNQDNTHYYSLTDSSSPKFEFLKIFKDMPSRK